MGVSRETRGLEEGRSQERKENAFGTQDSGERRGREGETKPERDGGGEGGKG